jgi:hypothetical protein
MTTFYRVSFRSVKYNAPREYRVFPDPESAQKFADLQRTRGYLAVCVVPFQENRE